LTEQTTRASDRRDDVAQNIRINVRKRHALLCDVEIEWQ
jgi:pilus assembly protein Flp/PilA